MNFSTRDCWEVNKLLFTDQICEDKNQYCSYWAGIGECSKNPNYMLDACAKSCEYCESGN